LGSAAAKKLLKNHVRLIYDCHELTPGLYQEWYGTVIAGVVERLENAALSSADAIISVNEAVHTHLTHDRTVRSILVYNCPAKAEIPDLPPIDAKKKLALQGFFVVLFAGWVRQDYDFASILKAAGELKSRGVDDVRFVFIGPAETMKSLTTTAVKENVETFFYFRGWVPNDELMLYYLASDLCYAVTSKLGPSTQILTPIKMFESMACGVPVIVRAGTLAAEIVNEWRCGIILAPERNDLASQLIKLKESSRELSALGSGGRRAFLSSFNWDSMEERLLQLYSDLYTNLHKK
jgi:glycosyltransferase involved in cell wall biosynthesis